MSALSTLPELRPGTVCRGYAWGCEPPARMVTVQVQVVLSQADLGWEVMGRQPGLRSLWPWHHGHYFVPVQH